MEKIYFWTAVLIKTKVYANVIMHVSNMLHPTGK